VGGSGRLAGRLLPVLALLGTLAAGSAGARAAGSLVVLLRSPAADTLARQSETLLAAELRAAGFQVHVADSARSATSDLRADMDAAARALDPIAVLAVSRAAGDARVDVGAEIWLLDRVTGKLVIRRVDGAPAGSATGTAGDVALRAVELLRGSLLEIALEQPRAARSAAGPAAAPPPADVSRFVTASNPALFAGRRAYFSGGLGIGAAATALGAFTGLGPSYAPALRLSWGGPGRAGSRLALRLSAVGLGSAAETSARDGDDVIGHARVRQSLLVLEGLLAFRGDAGWQPYLTAGVGAHHLDVQGTGTPPLFSDGRGSRLGAAVAAGGGLALRLGLRAALLLEAQLVAAAPVTPVMIADQRATRVGGPAALLSAGFAASL
jgi:hypothetical protein